VILAYKLYYDRELRQAIVRHHTL